MRLLQSIARDLGPEMAARLAVDSTARGATAAWRVALELKWHTKGQGLIVLSGG